MFEVNDFIKTITTDRETIVEKLATNYEYNHLVNVFNDVGKSVSLYDILTGKFVDSKYDKSSIDWIPSRELVDSIIYMAKKLGVKHIEEIYSGTGLLSALLSMTDRTLNITTADNFNSVATCNKLNFIPIAKRTVNDYNFYPLINESYPEMIISTYYPVPTIPTINENSAYIEEISNLIASKRHNIIILILPQTITDFFDLLYYTNSESYYTVETFCIKALDKYFAFYDLIKKYYKNSMMAHILVKTDLLKQTNTNIPDCLSPAIISQNTINTNFIFIKWLMFLSNCVSPELLANIYETYDFSKPYILNLKVKNVIKKFTDMYSNKIYTIPQYIHKIDEFLLWCRCISKDMFFLFKDRSEFYNFYTFALSIEISETKQTLNFPKWIKSQCEMYIFIYLETISLNTDWKKQKKSFMTTFDTINRKNSKIILNLTH